MKKTKPTILDIARISGVSKSTVSRVLTGSSPVSEGKKKKILKAIEELGYYPNLAARSLSGRTTGTIGIILNLNPDYHFSDYISMETLRGISSSAVGFGFRVSIIIENLSKSLPRILQEGSVDGVIIMGLKRREDLLAELAKAGKPRIPIVLLNYSEEYSEFPSVSFSHLKDAYNLAIYVLSMGHRKIGFLDCSPDNLYVRNRNRGFRQALKDNGIEFRPDWHIELEDVNEGTAGRVGAELLLKLKEKPTVIIASSDNAAISLMAGITAAGFRIPEDISVIGIDDIPIAKYVYPALTTEHLNGIHRGRTSCNVLKSLLEGKQLPEKHVFIPSIIMERESLRRI